MQQQAIADIGVFGGSGFYEFLKDTHQVEVKTPYGDPSDKLTIGTIGDKKVAFLPRHGANHSIAPHKINYRANVWAMKSLGIKRVISPCAAGSLQKHVEPGSFVICDQFVNKTWGREDTFFEGPQIKHISAADPYCPQLRKLAVEAAKANDIKVHEKGTILVVQGPRFSTKAESKFFTENGWEVINMTQYPEVYLVKEMDMCPLNISLITDYDAGLVSDSEPVSHEAVLKVFNENNEKLKKLLFTLIENIPNERTQCNCADASNV